MKEIVVTLIAGTLTIPLFILFIKINNEFEAKKRRKERLYFAEKRLHKLVLRFRDDCMVVTKKVITQFTATIDWKSYLRTPDYMTYSFLFDYQKEIDAMQEDYLVNYAEKYSEGDDGLRCEAEDLPRYILDEYEAEITEIANTFGDLCDSMRQQLEELKKKNQ